MTIDFAVDCSFNKKCIKPADNNGTVACVFIVLQKFL